MYSCMLPHAPTLLLLLVVGTAALESLYLNFECYYDGEFCTACSEGVLSQVGNYNLTVVGELAGEAVRLVFDATRTSVPLLLDSYFGHRLNDHLREGVVVWTTTAAQAASAAGYLQRRNLTGNATVRDFAPSAAQWQLADDSEQWFWRREGKQCGDPGMCG